MEIRDIQSMLKDLEALLSSKKGLNPSGRVAINEFLLSAEYTVRASLITDIINKNEPEMDKVRTWIASEISKMEDEKRNLKKDDSEATLTEANKAQILKLESRLRELRSIGEGIESPETLAKRMAEGYKNPSQREHLINTMGEYLCVGYDSLRTFKGEVLAPRANLENSFKGYSLNVEPLKELIDVVKNERMVAQAGLLVAAEDQVIKDETALRNLETAATLIPNEQKILDCAHQQRIFNDASLHYNSAHNSLVNYDGNAVARFFSSHWGKLKRADKEMKAYETTKKNSGDEVKKLLGELNGLGLKVDEYNIIGTADALPDLKSKIENAFNLNIFGKSAEDAKTIIGQCKTKKEKDVEKHKNDLKDMREASESKISGLSKADLETVLDCAGKGKNTPKEIGERRDPRFALMMFELLIRENEITPDIMLDHGPKERSVLEAERSSLHISTERNLAQKLKEIKEKVNGVTKSNGGGEIE